MARFGFLSVAVIAIVIAISAHEASALKCWVCNSAQGFCGEFFDEGKADKSFLVDCKIGDRCVKTINNIGLVNPTVVRSCSDSAFTSTICGINNRFCEDCDSDGCNGAAQYGPIAMLIAVPMAIAVLLQ